MTISGKRSDYFLHHWHFKHDYEDLYNVYEFIKHVPRRQVIDLQRAVFEIKQNAVGRYYFVFKDPDGKGLIVSKSFADRASLESCVAHVRDKAKVARISECTDGQAQPPLFLIQKYMAGYTFTLIGFEGEIIFSSESYLHKEDCIKNIELLKNQSLNAGILDLV